MSAVHGGDIAAVAERYGVDASALHDFSANIAPDGPPPGVARVLARFAAEPWRLSPYPSPAYARLREALARMHDIEPEAIVVGHGSAALIDAALRAFAASSWLVPVPAFSEYRRALLAARSNVHPFALPASLELSCEALLAALQSRADAGLLVNTPHNPSGYALERAASLRLLEACRRSARALLVDEAFIDYIPERSIVAEAAASRHATVLRSLTKFYALAGVRVGYAVTHPDRARVLQAQLPSWPAGTLDEAIALAALTDAAYAVETRERNERRRSRLSDSIQALGIRVYPSAANFLLIEFPFASGALDVALKHLIVAGVVLRDCRSYEGLEYRAIARVAVLDDARNQRLVAALGPAVAAARA